MYQNPTKYLITESRNIRLLSNNLTDNTSFLCSCNMWNQTGWGGPLGTFPYPMVVHLTDYLFQHSYIPKSLSGLAQWRFLPVIFAYSVIPSPLSCHSSLLSFHTPCSSCVIVWLSSAMSCLTLHLLYSSIPHVPSCARLWCFTATLVWSYFLPSIPADLDLCILYFVFLCWGPCLRNLQVLLGPIFGKLSYNINIPYVVI